MSSDAKCAAAKDAEKDAVPDNHLPQHHQPQGFGVKGEEAGATPGDPNENPDVGPLSPGLDVHAVLGVPRPKRPSERSEKAEEEEGDSDTDDLIDSDDDTEEWQEGEYFVIEEDDEELKELQTQMLSENASLSRDMLVPIFAVCCTAYDKWIRENVTTVEEEEMRVRRTQLQLYQKVLELYGSDAEWQGLTHAQRVNRNKEAHETSLRAKELGAPPETVTEASVAAQKKVAEDTFSTSAIEKRIADSMNNLHV